MDGLTAADYAWGGLLLAGGAYEAYTLITKRPGDTLSETTRRGFRVHTLRGKVAFGAVWTSFSVWYFGHILFGWPFPGF